MSASSTQDVNGLQESTYTLEVEQVDTATTTRFNYYVDYVMKEYLPLREYTPEQRDVVVEILKVFPDEPVMVTIAWCESELDPTADRSNLGVDVGLFQINQVHLSELNRLGLDRRDLHDNITFAKHLYDRNGTRDWYMSAHCW